MKDIDNTQKDVAEQNHGGTESARGGLLDEVIAHLSSAANRPSASDSPLPVPHKESRPGGGSDSSLPPLDIILNTPHSSNGGKPNAGDGSGSPANSLPHEAPTHVKPDDNGNSLSQLLQNAVKPETQVEKLMKALKEEGEDGAKLDAALKAATDKAGKVAEAIAKCDLKDLPQLLEKIAGKGGGIENLLMNAILKEKFGISISKKGDGSTDIFFDKKDPPPGACDYPYSYKVLSISKDGEMSAKRVTGGGYTGAVYEEPVDPAAAAKAIKQAVKVK